MTPSVGRRREPHGCSHRMRAACGATQWRHGRSGTRSPPHLRRHRRGVVVAARRRRRDRTASCPTTLARRVARASGSAACLVARVRDPARLRALPGVHRARRGEHARRARRDGRHQPRASAWRSIVPGLELPDACRMLRRARTLLRRACSALASLAIAFVSGVVLQEPLPRPALTVARRVRASRPIFRPTSRRSRGSSASGRAPASSTTRSATTLRRRVRPARELQP